MEERAEVGKISQEAVRTVIIAIVKEKGREKQNTCERRRDSMRCLTDVTFNISKAQNSPCTCQCFQSWYQDHPLAFIQGPKPDAWGGNQPLPPLSHPHPNPVSHPIITLKLEASHMCLLPSPVHLHCLSLVLLIHWYLYYITNQF